MLKIQLLLHFNKYSDRKQLNLNICSLNNSKLLTGSVRHILRLPDEIFTKMIRDTV